jgi:fucose 4-O-acetylase-like acetyltransferase
VTILSELGRARPAGDVRAAGAAPSRDPFWDNVRFLAITLVVVGHSIEKLSDADLMAALYFAVYAFHMPLFAFVCGRFASAEPRPGAAAKMVSQIVVPYVLFSVVWTVLVTAVGRDTRLDLSSPYWHLWFLVALAVWRLVLPALASLRYPVTVSVVLAVAAGYFHGVGNLYDGGRIFGMLPFFVLGWSLRNRDIPAAWRSLRVRTAAVVVLLSAPVVAYLAIDVVRALRLRQWAQMEYNYVELDMPEWWAGLLRMGMFGIALVLGCAFLVLVPRGPGRMSGWGASTMYVFLLHLFPLFLLRELTDVQDWFDSAPRFALLVVLAVGWSIALSSAPVRRLFRPLVEPRVAWLFARRTAARGGVAGT